MIFFIWIVIKNFWCDIKSEKSENVLMLIVIEKCKKKKKNVNSDQPLYSAVTELAKHDLYCHVKQ